MCHVYPVGRLAEDGPEVSLWCGSIMANVKQQHRASATTVDVCRCYAEWFRWTKHLVQREVGKMHWTMEEEIFVQEEF